MSGTTIKRRRRREDESPDPARALLVLASEVRATSKVIDALDATVALEGTVLGEMEPGRTRWHRLRMRTSLIQITLQKDGAAVGSVILSGPAAYLWMGQMRSLLAEFEEG